MKIKQDKPFKGHLINGGENYGTIGDTTPYKDIKGEPLFVGDAVKIIYSETGGKFKTYLVKTETDGAFVMGIQQSCNSETGEIKYWQVTKTKSFEDIKGGEIICDDVHIEVVEDK